MPAVGDLVRLIDYPASPPVPVAYQVFDGTLLVIIPPGAGFGWRIRRGTSQAYNIPMSIIQQYTDQLGWWVPADRVEVVRNAGGRKRRRKPKPLRNRVCRVICETLMGGG